MSRFARPSAVFFDLDGTLIDSAPDLAAACETMRVARGMPPLGLTSYRHAAGAGARGILKVGFGIEPSAADFALLRQEFLQNYEACLANQTYAFDGVAQLLSALDAAQIPWGIITNKPIRYTQMLVAAMPVLQGAKAIVGGDSASAPKPDAAPMHMAAQQANVDVRRAWYVGDDKRDVEAARAAHMAAAFAANWGYMGEHHVASWGADAELMQPLALLQYVPAH